MPNKVKVVTAYVPLNVSHLSSAKYHELGKRLERACDGDFVMFDEYPFSNCWLSMAVDLPPANPDVPRDRYPTDRDNVKSNIVQHQRTSWAMQAMAEYPDVDIWVWLDLGVLKQGDWTGRPVTEQTIREFLNRLRNADMGDIVPFPAIWGQGPIDFRGINWRFVGSTHIWPTKWLPAIDRAYKEEASKIISEIQAVPNDLPVWAMVEKNHTLEIPFVSYSANHDNTQFVNFRGIPPETPLCSAAYFFNTDKGPHHCYTPHYYKALKDKCATVKKVLEVGIGYKAQHYNAYWPYGASLYMWRSFFPNAMIYGWDIAPEVMIEGEKRIKTDLVDQSVASSLIGGVHRLLGGPFDVICDDGSHVLEHQILTANILLPYLAKDGLFICEDINEAPQRLGNFLPPGYEWEAFKSRAEPDHAYTMLIRHAK